MSTGFDLPFSLFPKLLVAQIRSNIAWTFDPLMTWMTFFIYFLDTVQSKLGSYRLYRLIDATLIVILW